MLCRKMSEGVRMVKGGIDIWLFRHDGKRNRKTFYIIKINKYPTLYRHSIII